MAISRMSAVSRSIMRKVRTPKKKMTPARSIQKNFLLRLLMGMSP
jgi:hypothetical protein